MYESGYSQNKEARREERRAIVNVGTCKITITSETSPTSLSKILCSIWERQEVGWCVIRAYKPGVERRRVQLWSRSNEITQKKLRPWLDKHHGWDVEFCPVTFGCNLTHLNWELFERGRWNSRLREYDTINRRECLSYLEYGPLDRIEELGRKPDITIPDEDRGIWFTDYPSYIDYDARDGLFVWLPRQRLTADELIKLFRVPVRRDLRHYGTDRSTLMWLIGKKCVAKGMRDPDDIKTIIRASTAYQSRLEERGERQAERGLDADVRKLLREAQ